MCPERRPTRHFAQRKKDGRKHSVNLVVVLAYVSLHFIGIAKHAKQHT
jgi:hypothetical protein